MTYLSARPGFAVIRSHTLVGERATPFLPFAVNARSQGSSALTTREGNNTAARPLRPRYVLSFRTSTFEDDADSGATGWTSMRTRTRTL